MKPKRATVRPKADMNISISASVVFQPRLMRIAEAAIWPAPIAPSTWLGSMRPDEHAAPALIAYEWALKGLGRWGWIAAFVYCSCAALRLARFNVNTSVIEKRYFQGLPSPAAAALLTGFIWLMTDVGIAGPSVAWPMFALALYAGLTMVTNVPFYSFKDVHMKKSVPFVVIVLIALGIAIINIEPATVLFGLFVIYGLSGYVIYGWRKAKGVRTSLISTSTDEPEERGLHK